MQLSLEDFWGLAVASELLAPDECETLAAEFAHLKGSSQATTATLAEWLVARDTLTPYQASVLLDGRPGPFVFGPFVVIERIERGRLARLYRATYEGSQPVLLVFLQQLTSDARDHAAYLELAARAAGIKSPHVSRTFRATRQRGQVLIVAESLQGHTLSKAPRGAELPLETACQWGLQAALGLVALHAAETVYGAMCLSNLWLDDRGTLRLLQFPLVQPARRLRRLELPLLDYLAPEATDPAAALDPLCDVYALGGVLYELISGRVPFPGGTPKQKVVRHRVEFPQRLDALRAEVPEELADLVSEMLAKDPLLRCQSASEVAHRLAEFAATPGGGRAVPPKLDPHGLSTGYGAWTAPTWEVPPESVPPQKSQPKPKPRPAVPQASPRVENPPTATRAVSTSADQAKPPSTPAKAAPLAPTNTEPQAAAPVVASQPAQAADEAAIVIVRESTSVPPTRTAKRSNLPLKIGVMLTGGLVLMLAAVWLFRGQASNSQPPATTQPAVVVLPASPDDPVDLAPELAEPSDGLIDDDGQTLWASPTGGEPLDLRFIPGGAQLIAVWRPADLLQLDEGAAAIEALGPAHEALQAMLPETLRVPLTDIELLTVAFVPDEKLLPQANYVVRLAQARAPQDLLPGNAKAIRHAGQTFYEHDGRGYYFPESESGHVFACGPPAMMREMLDLHGQPLLRSGIEQLAKFSDRQRHFTLLLTPTYLFTDGQSLLAGTLAALHAPLRQFLDESLQAVSLSGHLGEQLFVEFRAIAPVDHKPLELKKQLQSRWQAVPEQIESHVAALRPQPYGQLVLHRFPRMVQLLRDYTRAGVEDRQVVLSAYLPSHAAHNLVLGAQLALWESAGEVPETAQAVPATRSAEELLAQPISLSFPRETLERALELVSRELGVPVEIAGADLQLEGITRNQSLNDVDERNQPAAEVLRRLLRLANPEGKLVYQVKSDGSDSHQLLITTRQAIQKRGERLPPGF